MVAGAAAVAPRSLPADDALVEDEHVDAGARQPLHLILAYRPVLEQRGEAARGHLRGAPIEVARRPDFDDLAPRDFLALTGVRIPAASADERPQPRGLIRMDIPYLLPRER